MRFQTSVVTEGVDPSVRDLVKQYYECDLECRQCQAVTSKGKQCKVVVCIGTPFCYSHREKRTWIDLRESKTGTGLGLFAMKAFEKDKIIGFYNGRALNDDLSNAMYGDGLAPYAIGRKQKSKTVANEIVKDVVDSACVRSLMSLANTAKTEAGCNAEYRNRHDPHIAGYTRPRYDQGAESNDAIFKAKGALIDAKEDQETMPVVTTKAIKKGEEILIWYGAEYIAAMDNNEIWHRTSKGKGKAAANKAYEDAGGTSDKGFKKNGVRYGILPKPTEAEPIPNATIPAMPKAKTPKRRAIKSPGPGGAKSKRKT
jgi:hypothetical protein